MFRSSIIDRYLIKEVLLTLTGVTLVLLLIFVSGQLVSLFGLAASGALQVKSILITLGLNIIGSLVFVLPLAFYIAILLAFSRLYKDNEMVVLAACGISTWRIMRAILLFAVLFSAFVGWLSLELAPWAESKSELITDEHKQKGDIENLVAGRFQELTKGEGVVYVQEYDQNAVKMNNVFMQHSLNNQTSIISADSGSRVIDQKTGDKFIVLQKGLRYEGPLKNGQTAVVKFELHGVRIEAKQPKTAASQSRQMAVPTMTLLKRGRGIDHAELQWRISSILLCIVLAVLAVPLSRTSPRQGRYGKLALALLIYIIYTNLLNVSRAWLNREVVSVYVGLWWVHILILIIGLFMFVQWKPLLHRMRARYK